MSRRLLAINPVDHPGGAETTLLRLLGGLRERGWSVELTTPGRGPLRDRALTDGIGWRALSVGGIGRGEGVSAVASFRQVRALGDAFDVVLLNGAVCGRLLPALVPARGGALRAVMPPRVRARVALHLHDMVPRVPRFWRSADLVLAASGAVARQLRGLAARVAYPPVDPDPPQVKPPWPPGDGPVIGFVGRLEPRKGALDLARAVPLIRRGLPDARVVIVGGEPYGIAPEYTREVLAFPQVEHYPWTEGGAGLMRHLDVLVLPAYREPFGTVLAEAMAVGTPVVATPVDGLPEVVRDGISGRLVPPGDPRRLAGAVLDVLAHRAEMGAAARGEAERFHTPVHVNRVEGLLVDLLAA